MVQYSCAKMDEVVIDVDSQILQVSRPARGSPRSGCRPAEGREGRAGPEGSHVAGRLDHLGLVMIDDDFFGFYRDV